MQLFLQVMFYSGFILLIIAATLAILSAVQHTHVGEWVSFATIGSLIIIAAYVGGVDTGVNLASVTILH